MTPETLRPIRWWSLALFLAVVVSLCAWAASGSRDAPPPQPTADDVFEVVPFAVELRGGDPVISERLRA